MTSLDFRPLAAAMTVAMAYALPVQAQSGGTVLFAQEGVQIINANGQARAARQGDVLQAGERIQTPANGITQVKLPDGSLMGLRPNAELRVDAPPSGRPVGGSVATPEVTLLQGGVRVVGAELVDKTKSSALVLKAGTTSVQMKGADMESAILKPVAGSAPAAGAAPGTYNRLATGSATLSSGTTTTPLQARQVSFVPANSSVPTTLTSANPSVFAGERPKAGDAGASKSSSGLDNTSGRTALPKPDGRPIDTKIGLMPLPPPPRPGDGMGMRPPPPPPPPLVMMRPPINCREVPDPKEPGKTIRVCG